MFHIDPISHTVAQFSPLFRIHHDIGTALAVIFLYGNGLSDIFFGNSQFLLYAQFHRKAVSIPTGFTSYEEALHGLETTKRILDGTCQHMMNARMTIGRRRTLKKYK